VEPKPPSPPSPLSLGARGSKMQIYSLVPLSCGRGARGEGLRIVARNISNYYSIF